MSDRISFANMKSMVSARLGNMDSTSDPLFSAYLDEWVNEAGNAVVLKALDKSQYKYGIFPELEDKWIISATTNGVPFLSMPNDQLIMTGMYSFDVSTGAGETTARKFMSRIDNNRKYELLSKSQTGWPRQWIRYGSRIYLHPTPTTAYISQTMTTGLAKENTLSGANDTFVTDGIWHPAVVDYAVFIGATWLGWYEEASAASAICDQKIGSAISIKAYEMQSQNSGRKLRNDPTRSV